MTTSLSTERPRTAPADPDLSARLLTLVQKGKEALAAGDLDTALVHFEEVVSRFPDRPEGHNNLGALYTSLGRFPEAEAAFSRVLELVPGNCNVHYNRGIVRIHLQRHREAAGDFETVLASFPEDADGWNNLGVALHLEGDFATACEKFARALELAPEFPNALLNLCDSLVADGRREEAIARCENRLAERESPEIRRKQLDLLAGGAVEQLERACAAAEEHLRGRQDDGETRVLLGRLLQARDSLDGVAG